MAVLPTYSDVWVFSYTVILYNINSLMYIYITVLLQQSLGTGHLDLYLQLHEACLNVFWYAMIFWLSPCIICSILLVQV